MATKARLWPDTPTHPGEILSDELEARQISTAAACGVLEVSLEELQQLLQGKTALSARVAWNLEKLFEDISARFWMGLQADYELATERLKQAAS